jgi:hypothetical protein
VAVHARVPNAVDDLGDDRADVGGREFDLLKFRSMTLPTARSSELAPAGAAGA